MYRTYRESRPRSLPGPSYVPKRRRFRTQGRLRTELLSALHNRINAGAECAMKPYGRDPEARALMRTIGFLVGLILVKLMLDYSAAP